jgi:hypothetical protein
MAQGQACWQVLLNFAILYLLIKKIAEYEDYINETLALFTDKREAYAHFKDDHPEWEQILSQFTIENLIKTAPITDSQRIEYHETLDRRMKREVCAHIRCASFFHSSSGEKCLLVGC